jgi:multidrug efflux pump subunit AcrA (membrane-fusion protein)
MRDASPVFDRLLAALKVLVAAHGVLPLSAALPHMHADTATCVRLQTLYKAQANAEREQVRSFVLADVDDALVKNAHGLRVLDGQRFRALDAVDGQQLRLGDRERRVELDGRVGQRINCAGYRRHRGLSTLRHSHGRSLASALHRLDHPAAWLTTLPRPRRSPAHDK